MTYDLVASVVTYNSSSEMLVKLFNSFKNVKLNTKLIVVDNSENSRIYRLCQDHNIEYIPSENNGFGAGHNVAIKKYQDNSSSFVILSPDLVIPDGTLEELHQFMVNNQKVGLCSTTILNPDGTLQKVHNRLPTFSIIFSRRFLPGFLKPFVKKMLDYYVMEDIEFKGKICVPIISGCFMFFNSKILKEIKGFDERYFMYFEDVDISRKVREHGYENIFYTDLKVYHDWGRGSYKNFKLMLINIFSAFKYFYKWRFKSTKKISHVNYYKE